jgi:hypothetical protein
LAKTPSWTEAHAIEKIGKAASSRYLVFASEESTQSVTAASPSMMSAIVS